MEESQPPSPDPNPPVPDVSAAGSPEPSDAPPPAAPGELPLGSPADPVRTPPVESSPVAPPPPVAPPVARPVRKVVGVPRPARPMTLNVGALLTLGLCLFLAAMGLVFAGIRHQLERENNVDLEGIFGFLGQSGRAEGLLLREPVRVLWEHGVNLGLGVVIYAMIELFLLIQAWMMRRWALAFQFVAVAPMIILIGGLALTFSAGNPGFGLFVATFLAPLPILLHGCARALGNIATWSPRWPGALLPSAPPAAPPPPPPAS